MQKDTRGEISAPTASQDRTAQMTEMNETEMSVEEDEAEKRSEDQNEKNCAHCLLKDTEKPTTLWRRTENRRKSCQGIRISNF